MECLLMGSLTHTQHVTYPSYSGVKHYGKDQGDYKKPTRKLKEQKKEDPDAKNHVHLIHHEKEDPTPPYRPFPRPYPQLPLDKAIG